MICAQSDKKARQRSTQCLDMKVEEVLLDDFDIDFLPRNFSKGFEVNEIETSVSNPGNNIPKVVVCKGRESIQGEYSIVTLS